MSTWVGHKIKNPKGKIGKVIEDNNEGMFRTLTVKFANGKTEDLVLNNVGSNFPDAKQWSWEYKNETRSKWVKFH